MADVIEYERRKKRREIGRAIRNMKSESYWRFKAMSLAKKVIELAGYIENHEGVMDAKEILYSRWYRDDAKEVVGRAKRKGERIKKLAHAPIVRKRP